MVNLKKPNRPTPKPLDVVEIARRHVVLDIWNPPDNKARALAYANAWEYFRRSLGLCV